MRTYEFKDVALLITHYNRSESLNRLLSAFRHQNCLFNEIIVSDDGSSKESQEALKELQKKFLFNLVTSDVNQGLGHNINKGQRAVSSLFTLYVQEDFIPTDEFAENFAAALKIFKLREDLDIVRFYSYIKYPYLKPYAKGFSEMYVNFWQKDYRKIYFYSDHPHLRRSTFLEKFGSYSEGVKGDKTEYRMCISFIRKQGKGLFYNKFKTLFVQQNSNDEPSTMTRHSWTQTTNPLISCMRYVYRQVKYNYDIYLDK
jgi:glycosyltransferase involved in cell wall biosynthesis